MTFGKLEASDRLQMPSCEAFSSVRGDSFPHGKDSFHGFVPGLEKTRIEITFPDPLQEDISMLIE